MTKKEALTLVFNSCPALVHLLEMHRDGSRNNEKARKRKCVLQTVKNQNSYIKSLFGVATMDEAVRHAMYFGIIAPKRQRAAINRKWSPELQHYHRNYIDNLTRAQKREIGVEEE